MQTNNTDTRTPAQIWWSTKLGSITRKKLMLQHFPSENPAYSSEEQVETIYKAEHPQPLKEVVNDDSMEGFDKRDCFASIEVLLDILETGNVSITKDSLAHDDLKEVKVKVNALVIALKDMVFLNSTIDRNLTVEWREKLQSAKAIINNIK